MNHAASLCFELLVNLFEGGNISLFLCLFLGGSLRLRSGRVKLLGGTAVYFCITTGLSLLTAYDGLYLPLYLLLLWCYSRVWVRAPLRRLFAVTLGMAAVILVSTLITALISHMFGVPLTEIYEQSGLARVLTVLLVQLADVYVLQTLLRLFRKGRVQFHGRDWLLQVVVFAVSAAIFILLSMVRQQVECPPAVGMMLLGADVLLAVINLAAVQIAVSLSSSHAKEQQAQRMEAQLHYWESYACTVRQQAHAMQTMRHDLKQTVSVLYALTERGSPDETRAYLRSFDDRLQAITSLLHTENPCLNALINTKGTYAKSLGLQFACTAPKTLPPFPDADLCTVLGNLIDNAIEGSTAASPEVTVQIDADDRRIRIRVRNRIAASVLDENPQLRSNKPDRGRHGFGIPSVREAAAQHGGTVDFYEQMDYFIAEVSLPVQAEPPRR